GSRARRARRDRADARFRGDVRAPRLLYAVSRETRPPLAGRPRRSNETGRRDATPWGAPPARRGLRSADLGDDVDLDGDLDLGVRAVHDLVLTRGLDRLAEQELAAVDLDVVGRLENLGDVLVADRPVDAAFTGTHLDRELGVLEHLCEAFSVRLALGELLGPLREASLQLGLVGLGGRER